MKIMKSYIVLAAALIVSSTMWGGCYTRLATESDGAAPEADFDTTAVNQTTAVNEFAYSAFINNPWAIGPFVSVYYPSPFARTRFRKKAAVSAYRPLPLSGTPAASNTAEPQAPSPHRQSGYQRSSSPEQSGSRSTATTPPRTPQSSVPATPPSTPRTDTPAPGAPGTVSPAPTAPRASTPTTSGPTTGAPATNPPPANNRAGGAARSGR